MSVSDAAELKRKLRASGFEIYRTRGTKVLLAERVRDNLIMDSGVAAVLGESSDLSVEVTVRAQASHFPGAGEDQIWNQAEGLAQVFLDAGYEHQEKRSEAMADPSDPSQSLDTTHEIQMGRSTSDLDGLYEELRAALARKRSTAD